MRVPVVDISECVDCEGCLELCPTVFRRSAVGYIDVIRLSEYPEATVQEVINVCPTDCIAWEEI